MRNWLKATMLLLAVTAMMATPALAAEYEFDDSDGPMYAPPTSVDQVIVVGGGVTESSNIDRSKNTAVIAPPFGSPESYLPGAGTTLIPQSGTSTGSSTISGETIYLPPASYDESTPAADTSLSSNKFTLPDGLFYEDGSLGRLKIPSLGLSVKVYEDESLESLAKGAGHFKSTSCWDGNVGLAGHNRGVPTISERSTPSRTATRSLIPRNSARAPTRCSMWGRLKKRISPGWAGAART